MKKRFERGKEWQQQHSSVITKIIDFMVGKEKAISEA